MRYIKIGFLKGLDGDYYQEVDNWGNVVRYIDSKGNAVDLPLVTESFVKEEGKEIDDLIVPLIKEPYVKPVETVCPMCGK